MHTSTYIYNPTLASKHPLFWILTKKIPKRYDVSNGQSMVHHWVLVGIGLVQRLGTRKKPQHGTEKSGVHPRLGCDIGGAIWSWG